MTQITPLEADDPLKNLSFKQAAFVREYVKDDNSKRASIAAGYKARAGQRLLKEPDIIAALAIAKKNIQKEVEYNSAAAVREIDQKIQEASDKNQYSAVAKLIELKMKATGLYQEKMVVDVKASKGNFIVLMPTLSPPPYAEETKQLRDVTPQELIANAKSQKA